MARACVVGADMTKFGVHDKPLEELFADAALSAIHDMGVNGVEIDDGVRFGDVVTAGGHPAPVFEPVE